MHITSWDRYTQLMSYTIFQSIRAIGAVDDDEIDEDHGETGTPQEQKNYKNITYMCHT